MSKESLDNHSFTRVRDMSYSFEGFENIAGNQCQFDGESYLLLSHNDLISTDIALIALNSVCFPNLDIHNEINVSYRIPNTRFRCGIS